MVSPFIKLVGSSRGVRDDGGQGHRDEPNKVAHVRTDEIREICEVRGNQRFRVQITQDEYDTGVAENPDDYYFNSNIKDEWWKFVPTVELTYGTRGEEHAHMIVASTAAEMLARIAERENTVTAGRLIDRGVWTAGVSYATLEYVTKPGTDDTYLALAPSKSTSVAVLQNDDFWAKITLPEAA